MPTLLISVRCLWFAFVRGTSVILFCGLLAGCGEEASDVRHYPARGLVRGLPPDHKTVDVQHENIAGFMPSMTMPFEVRDPSQLSDLHIGDAISFRLNVTDEDSWIDKIAKIDPKTLHLPNPSPNTETVRSENQSTRLREGDAMPSFQLVNQNNQPVSLQTFQGHWFVLTFIFTRCPIPNFCPRMSQNFAELQRIIRAATNGPIAATRLLTISFDPEHDTPAVLHDYAQAEGADPDVWTLATGSPVEIQRLTKAFSVFVQPEGETITHGLATALVDKKGKIEKIWRGNSWTPGEVLDTLRETK